MIEIEELIKQAEEVRERLEGLQKQVIEAKAQIRRLSNQARVFVNRNIT